MILRVFADASRAQRHQAGFFVGVGVTLSAEVGD
jgi:hypothetical protein